MEKERIKRYLRSREVDEDHVEEIANLISEYEFYFEKKESGLSDVIKCIEVNKLASKSRCHVIVNKRAFMYTYLKTMHPGYSLLTIGSFFGNKDHATVLNGLRRHKNMIETKDKKYKEDTYKLSKQFTI